MVEEISGEGDEIETQEKREKTKKTELGRGIGRDKTEYKATISGENKMETGVATE